MNNMESKNQVGTTQDDIFKLAVPGKRDSDYAHLQSSLAVMKDGQFSSKDLEREEILDFGNEGFLLNNLLTPVECAHIIKEGEKIGFNVIDPNGLDYRSAQRIQIRCKELSELLFTRARPYLDDIHIVGDPIKQHIQGLEQVMKGTWIPIGLNEVWRLCRYYPGGHFAPHYDGHFVRSVTERSLKTFMIYLNGDFTGGTTNFVDEKQKLFKDETGQYRAEKENVLCRLQPKSGQAIIFNHHRLHEGGKLLDGVKYILRTDVMYRRTDGPQLTEDQEKAILIYQDAERYEEQSESEKAAQCYRKAFKLWPALEDHPV